MSDTPVKISIVVPVYNRPAEVDELLQSLTEQSDRDFEIVIVEDGSAIPCDKIVAKYQSVLDIKYFSKANSGPGQSRNFGAERAGGNYLIYLDSDCVIPPKYMEIVRAHLIRDYVDAFGGPDQAHADFTPMQKAINYAMTSFLTTGGIRGGGEKLDKFYPRSFNMGYSTRVFHATGGFSPMRFGEDIDMSIRILKSGFKTQLIRDAFVFHKRRTNLRQFYKQVYNSGIARINLNKRHPGTLKLVHALPSLFVCGMAGILLFAVLLSWKIILLLLVFAAMLFVDATFRNRNLYIGMLATVASFVQLTGYGLGFLVAFWRRIVLGKDEFSAFDRNFYK